MHQRRFAFACLAVVAASPAYAQGTLPPGIAPGFERFEITDVTFTLRDDTFNVLTVDPVDSATAYIGTNQGRVYKTTDGGRVWTESIVISERSLLWATPGGSLFLGGIRSPGPEPRAYDLIGNRLTQGPLGLTQGPIDFPYVPGQLPRYALTEGASNPLADESEMASGGGGLIVYGLSQRAPRLSILVSSKGRSVPALNRIKFLFDRAVGGSAINNITVDPTDRRLLFAATANGLYKSYDAGQSWSRSFAGATTAERVTFRVAIRPGEPSLLILGTASGMYSSTDKGDSWAKNATVGGVVNDVAFDLQDPNYIYLATNGGVLRSTDGGQSFILVYFSTFPTEGDVRSIKIDPFDPETIYIGTMRGAYITRKARTASFDDWQPLEGVQSILAVPTIAVCSKHRGHIYLQTRVEMPAINYGANPPESAIIESWDAGLTWRQLFTGRSDGKAEFVAVDPKDPDQIWIAWSTALHRLLRTTARAPTSGDLVLPEGPSMSDLVLATLRHHDIELNEYKQMPTRGFFGALVPRTLTVTGGILQWSAGGVRDDQQFADNRYLQIADAREWYVMAWASWNLPELAYRPEQVPMVRMRVQHVNDELRTRLMQTIRRNYGELQRLRALVATGSLDIKTKVVYHLRIEQLEALVDLTSGGYLTRWHKKRQRRSR